MNFSQILEVSHIAWQVAKLITIVKIQQLKTIELTNGLWEKGYIGIEKVKFL